MSSRPGAHEAADRGVHLGPVRIEAAGRGSSSPPVATGRPSDRAAVATSGVAPGYAWEVAMVLIPKGDQFHG